MKRSQPSSSPVYSILHSDCHHNHQPDHVFTHLCTTFLFFFFVFFFTRLRGQYCPQKSCRTQSTWTDHYYKAINIFASAESFFIAVKLLLLFSSDCIRDQSRDFFTVFWDRSHHVILENERKRCWVRERLRRCCPFKIINKYYWTFPRLHYHTFFFFLSVVYWAKRLKSKI